LCAPIPPFDAATDVEASCPKANPEIRGSDAGLYHLFFLRRKVPGWMCSRCAGAELKHPFASSQPMAVTTAPTHREFPRDPRLKPYPFLKSDAGWGPLTNEIGPSLDLLDAVRAENPTDLWLTPPDRIPTVTHLFAAAMRKWD
jgi:hypothetical protein